MKRVLVVLIAMVAVAITGCIHSSLRHDMAIKGWEDDGDFKAPGRMYIEKYHDQGVLVLYKKRHESIYNTGPKRYVAFSGVIIYDPQTRLIARVRRDPVEYEYCIDNRFSLVYASDNTAKEFGYAYDNYDELKRYRDLEGKKEKTPADKEYMCTVSKKVAAAGFGNVVGDDPDCVAATNFLQTIEGNLDAKKPEQYGTVIVAGDRREDLKVAVNIKDAVGLILNSASNIGVYTKKCSIPEIAAGLITLRQAEIKEDGTIVVKGSQSVKSYDELVKHAKSNLPYDWKQRMEMFADAVKMSPNRIDAYKARFELLDYLHFSLRPLWTSYDHDGKKRQYEHAILKQIISDGEKLIAFAKSAKEKGELYYVIAVQCMHMGDWNNAKIYAEKAVSFGNRNGMAIIVHDAKVNGNRDDVLSALQRWKNLANKPSIRPLDEFLRKENNEKNIEAKISKGEAIDDFLVNKFLWGEGQYGVCFYDNFEDADVKKDYDKYYSYHTYAIEKHPTKYYLYYFRASLARYCKYPSKDVVERALADYRTALDLFNQQGRKVENYVDEKTIKKGVARSLAILGRFDEIETEYANDYDYLKNWEVKKAL